VLDANIASHLPPSRDHGAAMPIVAALLAGKDETAASLFAANAGVSHATATQTLANLSAETAAARADAKSSADRAAHNLAFGLWALVCGLLLGLVTAASGGWLGAGYVHRVYHLRAYPRALRH
jgi:predicted MFS family arabinose efflux permease